MKRIKQIPLLFVCFFWLSISISLLIKEDTIFSFSERRELEVMPELSVNSIKNGSFMKDFDAYSVDQFIYRDAFRSFKNNFSFNVYQQLDSGGLYQKDGYLSKLEYPLNEQSLEHAISTFTNIYDLYLKDNNTSVYYSIVPDKNYYLNQSSVYPMMDYTQLFQTMNTGMSFAREISIVDLLHVDSYYRTDTHWKQEKLTPVANRLLLEMGKQRASTTELQFSNKDFYGVYYGQLGLQVPPDTICYQTNDILENSTVFNLQTGKTQGIYDEEELTSNDPYEYFLSGATPLLVIDNEKATNDDHLILFRDSFGSSLAPLLVSSYKKITIIDTRYIQPSQLEQYVDFSNSDVLFLYSTLVLNNSATLKK